MPAMTENFLHPLFSDHMVLQQGDNIPVWGSTEPGGKVTVRLGGVCKQTIAQSNGRWMVHFDNLKEGGPHEMTVSGPNNTFIKVKDVYVGEVWLCSGQSNLDQRVARGKLYWCGVDNEAQEIASANYPLIRLYSVRLQLADKTCSFPANENNQHFDPNTPCYSGQWTICSPEAVGEFSAAAYFFSRELQAAIKKPIGLITSCYGASTIQAWCSTKALNENPRLTFLHKQYEALCADYATGECFTKHKNALQEWNKANSQDKLKLITWPRHLRRKPALPRDPRRDQHSPSVAYNGMIAPLVPYAIKGAIWYHGESNGATALLYYEMLRTLIVDWRNAWGMNLAFLIVQITKINEPEGLPIGRQQIPLIRDAQLQALSVENTGLVVTIDLGSADVHLRNKQPLGKRLALTARGLVYGESVAYSGPFFDRMIIEDNKARIYFKHADGLFSSERLGSFIMAGADGEYHWAEAEIDGETVVVSCPLVPMPVAVRYAWAENPSANLYNCHGLPASPFRTDRSID